jgi:hypothetical protein
MKIILAAIIIGIIILLLSGCNTDENFIDIYSNMITFTQIDNVLIKSYKINSVYSLYGDELLNLFHNNNVIKINIPYNYSVTIRYSLKDDTSIIVKTIELPYGTYDIYKLSSDKIINQIDIKNMVGYNNDLLVTSNLNIPVYWNTDLYDSYRPEYYGYRGYDNHHEHQYDSHRFNHDNNHHYNHDNKHNYNHDNKHDQSNKHDQHNKHHKNK